MKGIGFYEDFLLQDALFYQMDARWVCPIIHYQHHCLFVRRVRERPKERRLHTAGPYSIPLIIATH
jgi:hypothetical protein